MDNLSNMKTSYIGYSQNRAQLFTVHMPNTKHHKPHFWLGFGAIQPRDAHALLSDLCCAEDEKVC